MDQTDPPPRRYRYFVLEPGTITALFRWSSRMRFDCLALPELDIDLPEDATVVAAVQDDRRSAILVLIESEMFEPVPYGAAVPVAESGQRLFIRQREAHELLTHAAD